MAEWLSKILKLPVINYNTMKQQLTVSQLFLLFTILLTTFLCMSCKNNTAFPKQYDVEDTIYIELERIESFDTLAFEIESQLGHENEVILNENFFVQRIVGDELKFNDTNIILDVGKDPLFLLSNIDSSFVYYSSSVGNVIKYIENNYGIKPEITN